MKFGWADYDAELLPELENTGQTTLENYEKF